MASLTLEQIAHSPEHLTRDLCLPDEEHFAFRLLLPDDGKRIGCYFESLSDETRSRFGPHPLDMATGHALCAEIDYSEILRFIAVHKDAVIAYFLLILNVRSGTRDRYSKYGIDLVDGEDCVFAPSVSDAYQSQGLGSILLPQILDIAALLGFSRILLSGGTHSTNHRAIRYYQKFGFEEVGRFETTGDNIDMIREI